MQYVLIADDDGALTRVLESRLRAVGVRVVTAHDATHALFLMQSSPPALAILDVRMPAGNGLAVCEMMRDNSQLAKVSVVVISGHGDESVKTRARILNAEYICKGPGLWDELRPLCERFLGRALKQSDQPQTEHAAAARS